MSHKEALVADPTNRDVAEEFLRVEGVAPSRTDQDALFYRRVADEKIGNANISIAEVWRAEGKLPDLGLTESSRMSLRVAMIALIPGVSVNISKLTGQNAQQRTRKRNLPGIPTVRRGAGK